MAATAVTVNSLDHKTTLLKPDPTALDAVNGNKATNGGTLILEFGGGAAGGTVELAFAHLVDGQAVAPIVYTLAASETRLVGGFPVSIYGSEVTFTGSVNTLTVIAYQ